MAILLRRKVVIAIIIMVIAMFLLGLFGIALLLHVNPHAEGPGFDFVRWLEALITPQIVVIQEWMQFILRKFAELHIPGIS